MNYKRLTVICGHYGTGKTNIAVNMALDLRKQKENVAVADLDIVNPYFRTKDSSDDFLRNNIRLICSEYANTNLDIPALPQDLYSITDDKSLSVILDIGGDDRGAFVLGRLAPEILKENNFDMLFVLNKYRPLTPDADSAIEVMREIEAASGIKFTGIVNNSNLGAITTKEDVLNSIPFANEVARLSNLPIVLTTAESGVAEDLKGEIDNIFPLQLQKRPIDI